MEAKHRNMNPLRFKEIYDFIIDNKLYRDPSLSASRLAHHVKISTEELKALFESYCGKDFKCFIAELRVLEARKMIEENSYRGFSIEAIGRMSGFNSTTEFVSRFKNSTGRLPKDYKENCSY